MLVDAADSGFLGEDDAVTEETAAWLWAAAANASRLM